MIPNTSRTLLVTLLGAFGRRVGDWLPVKGIVALLEELGVDESSTRTGVSRLKKRGWLEPEKQGGVPGYRLTDLARATLASGDEYIWHARQPADLADGWCVATFSVPERQRANRHLLRSRLASLGFGNVGQGVWIAPARMAPDALELVSRLELTSNTIILVGQRVGGQDLAQLAREAWDLEAIDAGYRDFVTRHAPGFEALSGADEHVASRTAYAHYLRALDDWRVLPMRDPGLPRELLPADWAGDAAAHLIEDIVTRLDATAFDFVRAVLKA